MRIIFVYCSHNGFKHREAEISHAASCLPPTRRDCLVTNQTVEHQLRKRLAVMYLIFEDSSLCRLILVYSDPKKAGSSLAILDNDQLRELSTPYSSFGSLSVGQTGEIPLH